jgi:hypothetical protein
MIFRDIESTVVPQALAKGLSIIPYSPLQRGLLTGKINAIINSMMVIRVKLIDSINPKISIRPIRFSKKSNQLQTDTALH